jgi:predicted transposase YdaD
LSNKKQEAAKGPKDAKPFDGLLKAVFAEQSEEIIAALVHGTRRPEGLSNDRLDVELNRNTLAMDIGRHIFYEEEDVTFNLEAQSGPDDDLLPRMHEYALNLYRTYHRPVLSVALLLFKECGVPEVPFTWHCGGKVRSVFYPIIICMWEKDAREVVQAQQRCLYYLLPTMKHATVDLLTRAVREMREYDDEAQFRRHLLWFRTMLRRTTTILQQDKQKIEEVLQMQYPGYALFREDPVIHGMILEGELKGKAEGKIEGKIEGVQDSILDFVKDRFSPPVVAQVQQTVILSHNLEKLKVFLRQLFGLADEQEVLALLTECFPLPGEIKTAQEMILEAVGARFSSEVATQVQQAIAASEDVHQLKMFLRGVVQLSDEQEVSALLTQLFPNAQDEQ